MAALNGGEPISAVRDLTAELCDALASSDLPVLPAVDLAARGDWFDVVPLPDGRIAFVVGDVAGRGLAAAAAMSQLRAVLDEILVDSADLAASLARIDRLASRESGLRAATVCVVALDPRDASIEYATCGHPPPLMVNGAGRARSLAPSGAGPLGTRSPIVLAAGSMRRDETLVLSSDSRLGDRMTAAGGAPAEEAGTARDLEQLCDVAVDLSRGPAGSRAVTVLAVRLRPTPTAPLVVTVPATIAATRDLRRAVSRWLLELGADVHEVPGLELAIGEVTANVVEHAYPAGEVGEVRFSAALDNSGVVHVDIADDGAWRTPDAHPATRGRGLWLAGEMVDELHVAPGDGDPGHEGTVVHLHRRLRRETAHTSTAAGRRGTGTRDNVPLRMEVDGASLRVYGPIDVASAPHFAESLNRLTRGGLHPFVIDLSAVTCLNGAGIRVLFELRDRLRGHGHRLSVRANPGTPAHDVLQLVGLTPSLSAGPQ